MVSPVRIVALAALTLTSITPFLQLPAKSAEQEVIGVISGSVSGTYARFAHEMSSVLDSESIRVLAMLGKGSQQNIKDLLYLNGVDIAIVQSDVLDFFKSNQSIPNIEESIRYIGKLYNEEIHIVTRKNVDNIKALEGELVAVGPSGSGTEMTAATLFGALGITVDPVNLSNQEALSELKAGNIEAAIYVLGKPGSIIQSIAAEDDLQLLSVSLPKTVQAAYFDTVLSNDDYPALIAKGDEVPTVAVGAVLAVFNWREGSRRFGAVTKFCGNLVAALDLLRTSESYHPKWKEVDFAVEVPGWERFAGMEPLLAASRN